MLTRPLRRPLALAGHLAAQRWQQGGCAQQGLTGAGHARVAEIGAQVRDASATPHPVTAHTSGSSAGSSSS